MNYSEVLATRAARLFQLVPPIKFLICCVIIDIGGAKVLQQLSRNAIVCYKISQSHESQIVFLNHPY